MRCQQCKSYAVMPKSKSCLCCGFRNIPIATIEPLAQKDESIELAQQKYLNKLKQISLLATKGQINLALHYCHRLNTDDQQLKIKHTLLESRLWQYKDNPERALKLLKKVKHQLPFHANNLHYYYRLACLLQQQGEQEEAEHIFEQFIEYQQENFHNDIESRYQELQNRPHKLALNVIEGGRKNYA
ncbi:MAG: hypothetical protein Q9M28_03005 [Mariprofundaceae bacterium]|nr:hypothetical protein [Mariprofundaceae bacterium]